MRTRRTIVLLLLIWLLVACRSTPPPVSEAETPRATPSVSPFPSPKATRAVTPTAATMSCTLVSSPATPETTQASPFPPIGENDWVLGSESALVTLLEYSDFQ